MGMVGLEVWGKEEAVEAATRKGRGKDEWLGVAMRWPGC